MTGALPRKRGRKKKAEITPAQEEKSLGGEEVTAGQNSEAGDEINKVSGKIGAGEAVKAGKEAAKAGKKITAAKEVKGAAEEGKGEEPSEAELKRAENALKDRWTEAGDLQAASLDRDAPGLPEDTSVACGVSLFLKTLKGQSAQTLKTYRVGCRIFMYFLYDSGQGDPSTLPVTGLQPLVLEDYYLWLVDRYSRGKKMTVSGYMAGPRNLFSYLARRDITPSGVQYAKMTGGLSKLAGRGSYKTPRVDFTETRKLAEYMYRLKVPELAAITQALQPEDPEKAGDGAAGESLTPEFPRHFFTARRKLSQREIALRRQELLRDRALILTLYTTGMRREEVSRLNRTDLRDGRLEEVLITGKGDKERVVFFDEPTLQAVVEYLKARNDNYQPLFIQHRVSRGQPKAGGANFRLSPFSVWAVVQKWAGEIGIEVNPHDFRHALATTMLNNGAQLGEVQDVLGHASPVTTKMIYAHYERKTLKAAVNRHRVGVGQLGPEKSEE